jgi:hypothetical protein
MSVALTGWLQHGSGLAVVLLDSLSESLNCRLVSPSVKNSPTALQLWPGYHKLRICLPSPSPLLPLSIHTLNTALWSIIWGRSPLWHMWILPHQFHFFRFLSSSDRVSLLHSLCRGWAVTAQPLTRWLTDLQVLKESTLVPSAVSDWCLKPAAEFPLWRSVAIQLMLSKTFWCSSLSKSGHPNSFHQFLLWILPSSMYCLIWKSCAFYSVKEFFKVYWMC